MPNTHCKCGVELTDENRSASGGGWSKCKPCNASYQREYYRKRPAMHARHKRMIAEAGKKRHAKRCKELTDQYVREALETGFGMARALWPSEIVALYRVSIRLTRLIKEVV